MITNKNDDHFNHSIRLGNIKNFLNGKQLETIVDYNNDQTENFVNLHGDKFSDDSSSHSHDTRSILNKKALK